MNRKKVYFTAILTFSLFLTFEVLTQAKVTAKDEPILSICTLACPEGQQLSSPCTCEPVIEVTAPICGNLICEAGEANVSSPGGCGPNAPPECLGPPAYFSPGTCPQDCSVTPTPTPIPLPVCGNNVCESGEASQEGGGQCLEFNDQIYCTPSYAVLGTCPQDCSNSNSDQAPTPTPTPPFVVIEPTICPLVDIDGFAKHRCNYTPNPTPGKTPTIAPEQSNDKTRPTPTSKPETTPTPTPGYESLITFPTLTPALNDVPPQTPTPPSITKPRSTQLFFFTKLLRILQFHFRNFF